MDGDNQWERGLWRDNDRYKGKTKAQESTYNNMYERIQVGERFRGDTDDRQMLQSRKKIVLEKEEKRCELNKWRYRRAIFS